VAGLDIWNRPVYPPVRGLVNDGGDWLLEARDGSRYHAIHLNNDPKALECIKEFCRFVPH